MGKDRMPVKVTRIDARIYRYQVIDAVDMDDLRAMINLGVELAEGAGENPHIRIIDASELKRIPIDMQGLIRLVSSHKDKIKLTMVVQAPSAARVMVQGVRLFVPTLHEMAFHANLESAVEAARSILTETIPGAEV